MAKIDSNQGKQGFKGTRAMVDAQQEYERHAEPNEESDFEGDLHTTPIAWDDVEVTIPFRAK